MPGKSSLLISGLSQSDEPAMLEKPKSFLKAKFVGVIEAFILWFKNARVSPQNKKVPDNLRDDLGLPPRVKEYRVRHRYWQL